MWYKPVNFEPGVWWKASTKYSVQYVQQILTERQISLVPFSSSFLYISSRQDLDSYQLYIIFFSSFCSFVTLLFMAFFYFGHHVLHHGLYFRESNGMVAWCRVHQGTKHTFWYFVFEQLEEQQSPISWQHYLHNSRPQPKLIKHIVFVQRSLRLRWFVMFCNSCFILCLYLRGRETPAVSFPSVAALSCSASAPLCGTNRLSYSHLLIYKQWPGRFSPFCAVSSRFCHWKLV